MGLLSREYGNHYELEALKLLKKKKLVLVKQNYHCRYGEIDLIMTDNHCLVFIEVKFRKDNQHGWAAETVTSAKQKKIILAAKHFLMTHSKYQNYACRFDVIAFDGDNSDSIDWLESAFIE